MRFANIFGAGGAHPQPQDNDSTNYSIIGSDGVGMVVTLAITPAEAEEALAQLHSVSPGDWQKFIASP